MNFFTSLTQLRQGFGSGKPPSPDTYHELGDDQAPSFKQTLDQNPPEPMLDDAAILARAALAATVVNRAADVEFEKHMQADDEHIEFSTVENVGFEMTDEDPETELDDAFWNAAFPEPPLVDAGVDVVFDTSEMAATRFIKDFDPEVETLEIELHREPGDDRPLQATDMALFLHDDGTFGAAITLRLAATDTAPAASTNLRICGFDDIDLDKLDIKIVNPTA